MPLVDPVTTSSASTPTRRRRGGPPAKSSAPDDSTTEGSSSSSSSQTAASPSSSSHATPLVLAVRHGSPLLLLAGLALSFGELVGSAPRPDGSSSSSSSTSVSAEDDSSNGIRALAGLLAASTVVQVTAAVVGLSPAGSDAESQKKRRARRDQRKPNVFVATLLSLLLTVLAVPLGHAVLVLFGAPFLVHAPSTLLCAAHLAVLGLFPVVFTHGTDSPGWLALLSGDVFTAAAAAKTGLSTADVAAAAGLWGTCIGAWLGAVPIPLDWDRPWQRWPITVLVGAYVGHAVARLLAAALFQQRTR